jgi:hypothetical protein
MHPGWLLLIIPGTIVLTLLACAFAFVRAFTKDGGFWS